MRIDQLSVPDAIASLHSAPQGLSAEQAMALQGLRVLALAHRPLELSNGCEKFPVKSVE